MTKFVMWKLSNVLVSIIVCCIVSVAVTSSFKSAKCFFVFCDERLDEIISLLDNSMRRQNLNTVVMQEHPAPASAPRAATSYNATNAGLIHSVRQRIRHNKSAQVIHVLDL